MRPARIRLEYRRALAAEKSPLVGLAGIWPPKKSAGTQAQLPPRVGRGIALGEPFGSCVCVIMEVEVTPQGEVRLRRAVVALDCGIAINPSSIEAQVQGGLIFGLSAALYSGITLKQGAIEQSNFHDYRSLRMNEMPAGRGAHHREHAATRRIGRSRHGHRRAGAVECHFCRHRRAAAQPAGRSAVVDSKRRCVEAGGGMKRWLGLLLAVLVVVAVAYVLLNRTDAHDGVAPAIAGAPASAARAGSRRVPDQGRRLRGLPYRGRIGSAVCRRRGVQAAVRHDLFQQHHRRSRHRHRCLER